MIAIASPAGRSSLFADEPTTAPDVTVQAQILDPLQAQQRERFMAMVLVTHDLGVVAGRADDIAVMYAGQIVEKAPTSTLFADMKHPYTEALVRSIPKLNDPSHTRLITIGGRPPNLIAPPVGCRFSPRCPYVQDGPYRGATTDLRIHSRPRVPMLLPVGTPEGRAALERNRAAAEAALLTADAATQAAAAIAGGTIFAETPTDAPGGVD
jgi:peptide/nickel transport system ATP-binding protein